MSFKLDIAKILLLIGVFRVFGSVLASEPFYPEVEDINKCDKKFERICAVNNYGYSFWYASECLLKYRNFWERTVNTKWDVRYTVLTEDESCIDNDKKQCKEFTLDGCKDSFGYEESYKVCKSNGKEYKEFTRYCDYAATFCNETESGWATVKMKDCSFKFDE